MLFHLVFIVLLHELYPNFKTPQHSEKGANVLRDSDRGDVIATCQTGPT